MLLNPESLGVGHGDYSVLVQGLAGPRRLVQWLLGFGSELWFRSNSLTCRTHLPMQETEERQGESLGWEDPLKEGLAVRYSILAWRIPRTEEPEGLQPMGSQRVGHDWSDLAHTDSHLHASLPAGTLGDIGHVPLVMYGRDTGGQDIPQKFT